MNSGLIHPLPSSYYFRNLHRFWTYLPPPPFFVHIEVSFTWILVSFTHSHLRTTSAIYIDSGLIFLLRHFRAYWSVIYMNSGLIHPLPSSYYFRNLHRFWTYLPPPPFSCISTVIYMNSGLIHPLPSSYYFRNLHRFWTYLPPPPFSCILKCHLHEFWSHSPTPIFVLLPQFT